MKLKEALQTGFLLFDGAMGTMLQEKGLAAGMQPEYFNLTHPEVVTEIHRQYVAAGADIITANTFQANGHKIPEAELPKIITAAVKLAKDSGARFVAYDMGPIGALLAPLGTLSFDEAYELFAQQARLAERAGADLVVLETVSDLLEAKAAILAIKENTELPVFVTMTYQADGRTFVGCDPVTATLTLQALGVDALGVNCSLGPKELLPVVEAITRYAQVPVVVQANAGLPEMENGATVYRLTPKEYLAAIAPMLDLGVTVVGGCCGTTPAFTRGLRELLDSRQPVVPVAAKVTAVTSGVQTVILDERLTVIGERLNPTGKKRLQAAIRQNDLGYLLKEGIQQVTDGGDILDVNVGLPDIDEVVMMKEVVRELQSVTSLPLQIDTVDTEAMEQAMRIYNGKPMVNSVSGKQESMNAVFPLIQKYGGVVIGLTLDENGIPKTAKGRLEVAGKIIEEAKKYGIDKKDIVIDVLTMTISSEPNGAKTTLEALKMVRDTYGARTALGVSNISFGLPSRPVINANFYTMAMQNGLTAGIINPSSDDMMRSYHSYCALMNYDTNCENYIAHYGNQEPAKTTVPAGQQIDLKTAIEKGLKEDAYQTTVALVKTKEPLEIINTYLIPALDTVGKGFEKGTVFLPQLLMSADAAKSSFAVLKEELEKNGGEEKEKEKVILATVKGDIHDIGKNIVKVLLENYSFEVIDLGKDVAPECIVETVLEKEVKLVGLSALMTTTVVSMEETIRQLREKAPDCKVMVGGAVLNQEYADMIGADFYGKDAMQSVYYAQKILTNHR